MHGLTGIVAVSLGGCPSNSTGQVGWFVNGVALYGWSDSLTYRGEGVWENLAAEFDKFDLDACLGHATAITSYHRMLYDL